MKNFFLKTSKHFKIIIISLISFILCATISCILIFSNMQNNSIQTSSEISENKPSENSEQTEPVQDKKDESYQTFNDKPSPKNKSEDPCETVDNKDFDFSSWNKTCDFNLVVINKDNPVPDNFDLQLSPILGYQIHTKAKESLLQMINDAKSNGINLYISSGYRSIERQTMLFNRKVNYFKKKGFTQAKAEIQAARVVARPKTSEHNSGLAVDLNGVRDDFYKTKEYSWLMNNSYKYGFILRYPKDKINITNIIYEPWHFRFVGVDHAQKITSQNLCLEEYIESLI